MSEDLDSEYAGADQEVDVCLEEDVQEGEDQAEQDPHLDHLDPRGDRQRAGDPDQPVGTVKESQEVNILTTSKHLLSGAVTRTQTLVNPHTQSKEAHSADY